MADYKGIIDLVGIIVVVVLLLVGRIACCTLSGATYEQCIASDQVSCGAYLGEDDDE